MHSYVKGFLAGIFCLIVLFFMAVSITGEIRGHGGFIGEIQSWSNAEQSEQLPDENQEEQIKITENSVEIK